MGSFSAFHFVIAAIMIAMTVGIFYMIIRLLMGVFGVKTGPVMVCTTCHHVGKATTRTRGSILIEIVLWCCFIIPGLIYSLWRLSARDRVCSACGAATLVPPSSPVGRKLLPAGTGEAIAEREGYESTNKRKAALITLAAGLLFVVVIYNVVSNAVGR